MAIKTYTEKNILKSQDFINFTYQVDDTFYGVTTVDGRKIIKAGHPYPANGATGIGITFSDVDVTDGARNIAVTVNGMFIEPRLPVTVDAAFKTANPNIQFFAN